VVRLAGLLFNRRAARLRLALAPRQTPRPRLRLPQLRHPPLYVAPGLPACLRWSNRVLAKEIHRKHDDFADYFVCDHCHGEAKLKGIKQITGLLGGATPLHTAPGEWAVPLWDEALQKPGNADIDRLLIRKGGVARYDLAVNAVINTLKGDASRPLKWCKKIPVFIESGLTLPPGVLAMLKDTFKEIHQEDSNHAANH